VERRITTRRELIQAGRRLFGSQGIYESRIEDITLEAGIAKGTLYLHFTSKEDLLLAVTRDGLSELQAFVREHTGASRRLAVLLPTILRGHLDFFAAHTDLMRILHQVRGALKFGQPEWRPLRALLRQHVEFVAGELARGEARAWTPARRRALAALLFGTVSGTASVRAALYPDSVDLERLGEHAAEPLALALLDSAARGARNGTVRTRRAKRGR
jgi:TetR/AcrR family fatty acid metabolism transcriptional regulator